MFKLTVNNTEYKVSFYHDQEFRFTTCTIQDVNNPEHYFAGTSFVNPQDHCFNKGIGRFISLLRATNSFDRNVRKLFFDKYCSMSKVPHIDFKVKKVL
jgi:hypothetical protein